MYQNSVVQTEPVVNTDSVTIDQVREMIAQLQARSAEIRADVDETLQLVNEVIERHGINQ